MAKRTITTTEYTDDIDGGNAAGTVSFSWDGTNYEIDLSKKNATAFEKAMKPYVDAARKVRATRTGRKASGASSRHDLAAVREWAQSNGYDVAPRGRIAGEVMDAYAAAH